MFNHQRIRKKSTPECFEVKVREFSLAIEKYNTISFYRKFETLVAILIVTLQIVSIIHVMETYHFHGVLICMELIFMAWLVTDFIGGIAHMIVDNNTNYTSITGPFVAAFHMHHSRRKYMKKHPLKIYFTESGQKFWLLAYLLILVVMQKFGVLNSDLNAGLVAFGVFSSIAEVSHYWCHNPPKNKRLIYFLQKYRILLSLTHHRHHHVQDNRNYAFLNGLSDPLLNIIASNFFSGYKKNSDKHVAVYTQRLRGHSNR